MSETQPNSQIGSLKAWLIWGIAASAFGYAFFQRVVPSVMVQDLMAEFAINATVLGTLSALYFYPYVLMQIPLGVLIDRWGARLLLTIALTIAGIGSVVFATAQTIELAYIGRLLIGIGSAVGFLGSLAIATKWFPANRFALLAGLVMFIGMMSAVFAQGPLAALVESNGWRSVMWGLGAAGLILAMIIAVIVRNSPSGLEEPSAPKQSWADIGRGLKQAATSGTVWKVAFVASTMSGPMLALGGLWGTPYMEVVYGLERPAAAGTISILFFGWAFGAPFGGWLSDRIKKRKALLVFGSGILTIVIGILVFIPDIPLVLMVSLLALIGASGGLMTVCFALVRESSPSQISASVIGIVNSMTVASGAILQPVVGYYLDRLWSGKIEGSVRVYSAAEFQTAFIAIFITCLIGFLVSISLRETPVWNKK